MMRLWRKLELWFWGKFFILLIALGAGTRRRRMSHNNGLAGRGKIRLATDQTFPATDFFEPGREFPCRIRHACVPFLDDAMKVARSATLKFADTDFRSPLDIQMNTGHHSFFWNARVFLEFAFSRHLKDGVQYGKYYRKYAQGRRAASSAFRIRPPSYADLYYHSQTPFLWKARDGKPRYAKFRLIPIDGGPERNAPTVEYVEGCAADPAAADRLCDQRCFPDETRSVNYLKNEWRDRLKAGPIQYRLQLQLHEVSPDDSPEIRNCHLEWDEATHPWHELAVVEITEELSHAEACFMAFEITNLPPVMGILPSESMDDYNSVNYMRAQSIWAIRMRRLCHRLFGPPKDLPDDGPHNCSPPGM
ncbi:MAG TPA: hypothetical protein VKE40_23805 [Gemmataceae bacterium]|nr:hypothetical protein [Gemmataceae bacterium]